MGALQLSREIQGSRLEDVLPDEGHLKSIGQNIYAPHDNHCDFTQFYHLLLFNLLLEKLTVSKKVLFSFF